ncbi:coiled-coil and C2 domain-containing protein 1-like isoform X2 [Mytilus trossulus]|uniref:coiled-coil and C2 domain-containing protein 1-like isoform X2 n=1 Tax=Mytilus trossulus TaxID=6551 RepID=UPI00300422E2
MFGSKKKQAPDPPKRKGASLANQMGIGDIENMMYGDVDNDEDLEAELLALQGEDNPVRRKPKPQQKALTMADLDKYSKIAEINEDDDDDEDVSDTEDPDLLAELENLSTEEDTGPGTTSPSAGGKEDQVILLVERLSMYEAGVESAKSTGDTSKQKRYDRGLKTIQDLLKKAQQGKSIDESDIPPAITVSAQSKQRPGGVMQPESSPTFKPTTDSRNKQPSPSPPKQPALELDNKPISPETSSHDLETEKMLETRRDQYKTAALQAKHTGDINTAKSYVQIAKQFDNVLTALKSGQAIDLSKMPPPPSSPGSTSKAVPPVQTASRTEQSTNQGAGEEDNTPAPSAEESRKVFKAPDPPKTVMEALEQRLEKYKSAEAEAKAAGEGSKARRHGRIVKQYQDSIKASKSGKPLNLEELPCPPGYAPFPTESSPAKSAPAASPSPQRTVPQPAATTPQRQQETTPQKSPSSTSQKAKPLTTEQDEAFKRSPSSRAEQTSHFLSERMNEYRTAALQAKKNNDIELAKKYIRIAKGFEPMIIAAESGLPVDMSQIPPSMVEDHETSTVSVSREDCELSGDRTEVFKKLEQDLIQQIRTCATNQQNFTKIGDVVSSAKFEKMEKGCRKDLESLKNAFRHNDPVPKFHYENRTFSLVKCNTDLGENDLELTIVRGLQYNAPSGYSEKDLDTYVKFEFPYPQEDPQVGTSETVKSTTNPEHNQPFKLEIARKSRAFARIVERKTVKLEVFYKRGFLKSDKLLGTVNVKLHGLDSECTLHDSHDLTEGRKQVGGKLEVKLRIRDPFKGKQVEVTKEKWLVIDQFIRALGPKAPAKPAVSKSKSSGTMCLEVLKYEKQLLDNQITSLKSQLTKEQYQTLTHKSQLLQQKTEEQQGKLKTGGKEGLKDYVKSIEAEIPQYEEEARFFAKAGDMHKAQVMLTKKKHVEKELAAIRNKYPDV